MNVFRAYLVGFAVVFSCGSLAQTSYSIGYNLGRFSSAQRNFEVLEYEFRQVMPKFSVPSFQYGASIGARMGEDNYFFEVVFANKKSTTGTHRYTGSDGLSYDYKLKTRLRTMNLGMAYGTEVIKLGFSLDVGMFKIFKRNGQSSADLKWENFYDAHSLFTGMTFFVPVQVGALEVRPYYQASFHHEEFRAGSTYFAHRSDNFGVNISIVISD